MIRLMEPLTETQRIEFVEAARAFIGAPWRHQGRRKAGMDCLGLVVLSLAKAGVWVHDRTDYGRLPHNRKLKSELVTHFGPPVANGLQPGDLVTLRFAHEENHIAIVGDHPEGLSLIHSWADAPGSPTGGGRVVEHRLDDYWRNLMVDVWRL